MPWRQSWGGYFDGQPIPKACYRRKMDEDKEEEEEEEEEEQEDGKQKADYKVGPKPVPEDRLYEASAAYQRLPEVQQAMVR